MADKYCLQMVACGDNCGSGEDTGITSQEIADLKRELQKLKSSLEKVELWSGAASTAGEVITLSDNLSDYKYIIIEVENSGGRKWQIFGTDISYFDLMTWNIARTMDTKETAFAAFRNRLMKLSETELKLGENNEGLGWQEIVYDNRTATRSVSTRVAVMKIVGIRN